MGGICVKTRKGIRGINLLLLIMYDRRLKVRETADAVGISSKWVHNILHEHLDVKKLCARWVPRLPTLDKNSVERMFRPSVYCCISAMHI